MFRRPGVRCVATAVLILVCLWTALSASAQVRGDFNGDGFDDLAIGAPGYYLDPFDGQVHVLYGTAEGPSNNDDDTWGQESRDIRGSGGGEFGWALAVGDFNDDGCIVVVTSSHGWIV